MCNLGRCKICCFFDTLRTVFLKCQTIKLLQNEPKSSVELNLLKKFSKKKNVNITSGMG